MPEDIEQNFAPGMSLFVPFEALMAGSDAVSHFLPDDKLIYLGEQGNNNGNPVAPVSAMKSSVSSSRGLSVRMEETVTPHNSKPAASDSTGGCTTGCSEMSEASVNMDDLPRANHRRGMVLGNSTPQVTNQPLPRRKEPINKSVNAVEKKPSQEASKPSKSQIATNEADSVKPNSKGVPKVIYRVNGPSNFELFKANAVNVSYVRNSRHDAPDLTQSTIKQNSLSLAEADATLSSLKKFSEWSIKWIKVPLAIETTDQKLIFTSFNGEVAQTLDFNSVVENINFFHGNDAIIEHFNDNPCYKIEDFHGLWEMLQEAGWERRRVPKPQPTPKKDAKRQKENTEWWEYVYTKPNKWPGESTKNYGQYRPGVTKFNSKYALQGYISRFPFLLQTDDVFARTLIAKQWIVRPKGRYAASAADKVGETIEEIKQRCWHDPAHLFSPYIPQIPLDTLMNAIIVSEITALEFRHDELKDETPQNSPEKSPPPKTMRGAASTTTTVHSSGNSKRTPRAIESPSSSSKLDQLIQRQMNGGNVKFSEFWNILSEDYGWQNVYVKNAPTDYPASAYVHGIAFETFGGSIPLPSAGAKVDVKNLVAGKHYFKDGEQVINFLVKHRSKGLDLSPPSPIEELTGAGRRSRAPVNDIAPKAAGKMEAAGGHTKAPSAPVVEQKSKSVGDVEKKKPTVDMNSPEQRLVEAAVELAHKESDKNRQNLIQALGRAGWQWLSCEGWSTKWWRFEMASYAPWAESNKRNGYVIGVDVFFDLIDIANYLVKYKHKRVPRNELQLRCNFDSKDVDINSRLRQIGQMFASEVDFVDRNVLPMLKEAGWRVYEITSLLARQVLGNSKGEIYIPPWAAYLSPDNMSIGTLNETYFLDPKEILRHLRNHGNSSSGVTKRTPRSADSSNCLLKLDLLIQRRINGDYVNFTEFWNILNGELGWQNVNVKGAPTDYGNSALVSGVAFENIPLPTGGQKVVDVKDLIPGKHYFRDNEHLLRYLVKHRTKGLDLSPPSPIEEFTGAGRRSRLPATKTSTSSSSSSTAGSKRPSAQQSKASKKSKMYDLESESPEGYPIRSPIKFDHKAKDRYSYNHHELLVNKRTDYDSDSSICKGQQYDSDASDREMSTSERDDDESDSESDSDGDKIGRDDDDDDDNESGDDNSSGEGSEDDVPLSDVLLPLLEEEYPNINNIINTLNEYLDPADVKKGKKYNYDYFEKKGGLRDTYYFMPGYNRNRLGEKNVDYFETQGSFIDHLKVLYGLKAERGMSSSKKPRSTRSGKTLSAGDNNLFPSSSSFSSSFQSKGVPESALKSGPKRARSDKSKNDASTDLGSASVSTNKRGRSIETTSSNKARKGKGGERQHSKERGEEDEDEDEDEGVRSQDQDVDEAENENEKMEEEEEEEAEEVEMFPDGFGENLYIAPSSNAASSSSSNRPLPIPAERTTIRESLAKASEALRDADFKCTVGRAAETDVLVDEITNRVLERRGGGIYVCGSSGLGKTLTVRTVIRKFMVSSPTESRPARYAITRGKAEVEFKVVRAQGTGEWRQFIYKDFARDLSIIRDDGTGRNVDEIKENVLSRFRGSPQKGHNPRNSSSNSSVPMTVLIIDEIDRAPTEIIKELFFAASPSTASSTLIVIGIANSINYPDELGLPNTAMPKVILFTTYKEEDLYYIAQERCGPLLIPQSSLTFIVKRICSRNGDVRLLLQMLDEILQLAAKEESVKTAMDQLVPPEGIVTQKMVMRAFTSSGWSTNREHQMVDALEPPLRFFLVSLIVYDEGRDENTSINKMYQAYRNYCNEKELPKHNIESKDMIRTWVELFNSYCLVNIGTTIRRSIDPDAANNIRLTITPETVLRSTKLEEMHKESIKRVLEARKQMQSDLL